MSRHSPLLRPAAPTSTTLTPAPGTLLQRKVVYSGQPADRHEQEADRAAATALTGKSRPAAASPLARPPQPGHGSPPGHDGRVPETVRQTLAGAGQGLDQGTRRFMETRFGHDFGRVRIHADPQAAASARAVDARAYTVGDAIVFGPGRYAPHTHQGRRLLAHELSHVLQQRALPAGAPAPLQREREGPEPTAAPAATPAGGAVAAPASTPAPRPDYIFIMGQDAPDAPRDRRFYGTAESYFRAHLPGATLLTDKRSLREVLSYIGALPGPVGNIYIVSHANEDGTLTFGSEAAGDLTRLGVADLREALHPAAGGASTLPAVGRQIDAQTTIHIKGCDLGRTRQMIELIDEAFGGAGTVTAPTHEQHYETDPTLDARARRDFRSGIAAAHPMPEAVDPALRGRARRDATAARRRALAERNTAIQAEISARQAEEDALAARAGTVESLSGPMFQRPGTTQFTRGELTPEVDRLYSHLSARQRRSLVQRLVARDPRAAAAAEASGVVGQRGQRVYRLTTLRVDPFGEPASLAEANRLYGDDFRANNFRATALQPTQVTQQGDEVEYTFTIDGRISQGRRQPPLASTRTYTITRPSDATLIAEARGQLPNPERYTWRVQRSHASSGMTTLSVVAERVVAYLHHGSLNPAAHQYFIRPESDADFYTTSTFAPPPAPAAPTP